MQRKLLPTLMLSFLMAMSTRHSLYAARPTASGATVRGIVRWEGKSPAPKPFSMGMDPVCAKQHPSPVMAQEVLVDTKGDLENAVVFVADGLDDRRFQVPVEPVVVEQKGCLYQPHVLAMRANQPLELVNEDATSHNIHPLPANNREWNKAEPPGSKMEETFTREEIAIPVKCNLHSWMRGYIAVFKHPFFAVTSQDGSFDLSHLPPGTYTIKAWHEKLGTAGQTVTVGDGETKQISFVFKGV
jgi:plastocyanin